MNLHDRLSPAQVLNTVFWLGKAANGVASYAGPSLNLKEFEGLLAQMKVVSGGGGRGRSVTFPPMPGLPEGRGKGREGARQKTNSFVFLPPRLFPISARDKRGTECGQEKMIGWAGFCCFSCRSRVTFRLFLGHHCFFLKAM